MAQHPSHKPPRLRIVQFGVTGGHEHFVQELKSRGHELLGLHAVPQADMIVIDAMDPAVPEMVRRLVPVVRAGQIIIVISFCHSLDVLEPLTAQGCHTIVLMPLAPNRYAFLAHEEVAAVVMELLITELASLCEHISPEQHQKFVAGFVLSQLAGEVYQLGAMLQNPSGNFASGTLGFDRFTGFAGSDRSDGSGPGPGGLEGGPERGLGDSTDPSDPADPTDPADFADFDVTDPAEQSLPPWLYIKPPMPGQTPQGPQELGSPEMPPKPSEPPKPPVSPTPLPGPHKDEHPDPQPLLPTKLLNQDALTWCAEALPTDHARSVFYTLLYYGLSQHSTTPSDLVEWAENQAGAAGGF